MIGYKFNISCSHNEQVCYYIGSNPVFVHMIDKEKIVKFLIDFANENYYGRANEALKEAARLIKEEKIDNLQSRRSKFESFVKEIEDADEETTD